MNDYYLIYPNEEIRLEFVRFIVLLVDKFSSGIFKLGIKIRNELFSGATDDAKKRVAIS